MSTHELTAQIEALRSLEELIEEAKAEAETLRDAIKQEMLNRDIEELSAGQYIQLHILSSATFFWFIIAHSAEFSIPMYCDNVIKMPQFRKN